LKIDITPLFDQPERPLSETRTLSPEQVTLDSETFFIEDPLQVDVTLSNEDGTITATGSYRGTLELVCGRCLTRYAEPLSGDFEALFLPTDEERRRAKEEADEPIYFGVIEDNAIDVGSIVRQDILVQCPMRPLCDEDCEGLCSECGANLNEKDCGHDSGNIDPRLSKLEEIAEEMSNEEN